MDINKNLRDLQLGEVTRQKGRPISVNIQKPTGPHTRY